MLGGCFCLDTDGPSSNAVLEFVSGAPNKERQVDEAPEVFGKQFLTDCGCV